MAATHSSAEATRENVNEIQVQITKDKSRGWQKRAQKWAKGRKLLEKLLDDPNLGSEGPPLTKWIEDEFGTATSSTDVSLTVALVLQLIKHIYVTYIKPPAFSIQESHTLPAVWGDQQGQLGALHIAGRMIVSLTELLLTGEMLNSHTVASHVDLFVRLLEACIEGKVLQAQAHTNLGELVFSIVSNTENSECRALLSEDSALGFVNIGKLLWKSQSSSITVHLLNTLQFLLPAHTAGKDSPRSVACRLLVMNQGWSKDIIKKSFSAIEKMDKKLCPDHLMKCINIFAQDQTFLRPKAFQLTSFIIDDEDQITSHKSKKNLKNGHLALYADRYCCRFTLYGDDGHELPRIFAYTEVEDVTRLDTKDGGSTNFGFQVPSFDDHMSIVRFGIKAAEASDLEAMMKKVKSPKPQALEGKAEKKASPTIVAQPDPTATADKLADGKGQTRFSSLARSVSPCINSNLTSEPGPLSKTKSIKSDRSSKVRVSFDAVEKGEDSTLALKGLSKENEANEKTQKIKKREELGKMEMKKVEWKTDAASDSDEYGISLMGKTSTPMTRSTKTYGSRRSRSSSARRSMQSKPPPPPMESSDSELETKPVPPPNSNRLTNLLQNRLNKKNVDEKSKVAPTIRAPTLKSRAKSLASSIAEGRAATPVSRGPMPVIWGVNEELFGSDGGNGGRDGKKERMGKPGRGKKDKVSEKALPVSITAPIPEPSSTSRRALIKELFPQRSSDEEEPSSEAEHLTKAGCKSLQLQTRTKVKNRGPSLPPTRSDESLKWPTNTRDLDCDPMAEEETKELQNKLTKKTTRKSTVKAAPIPQEKRGLAVPVSESESTRHPEEYGLQDSQLCQQNMVDLPCSASSFVTVKDITNQPRPKAKQIIPRSDDEDDDEQVLDFEEEYDEEEEAQTKKRRGRPIRGTARKDNPRGKKQKQISKSEFDRPDAHSNSDHGSDSDHPPAKAYKTNSKNKTITIANSKATKAEIKAQSKAKKNKSHRIESSEDEGSPTDDQASEPHSDLKSNSDSEQDVKGGKKLIRGKKSSAATTASSMSTKIKAQVKEIESSRRLSMVSKPSKKYKDMTESETEGKDEEEEKERPASKKTKKAQPSTKRKKDETSGSEEESQASEPSPKLAKVVRKGPGKTTINGKIEKKVEEAVAEEEPPKVSELLSGISKAMRKRVNTRSRLR
ncbi:hypothetical protein AYX15_01762 [Cryptococcus neoformans]|nr:hypothetical protein AYX15_01762 [Cryptococcus neoformans var. grubii]